LMASGRAYADADQFSAAHADFSQAIKLQPSFYLVWIQRAQLFAKLNCWEEAAADFEMAAKLGSPTDEPAWWGAPQLFWYTNRRERYQSAIESMKRKQVASEAVGWKVIHYALLSADSGMPFEQLADESETKLAQSRRAPQFPPPFQAPSRDGDSKTQPPVGGLPPLPGLVGGRGQDQWTPPGAQTYITGLAQLRAGRHNRAIELLKQVRTEDPGWPSQELVHFPLAIAFHQLGDAKNAKSEFEKGNQV